MWLENRTGYFYILVDAGLANVGMQKISYRGMKKVYAIVLMEKDAQLKMKLTITM